ncbi:MAG: hypothetical protein ACI8PB_003417 [Desulforhopalus sp.]
MLRRRSVFMKRLKAVLAIVCISSQLVLCGGALAAKPLGAGGGNATGGGGTTPPDYGDLFVLHRDDNGVPYVTAEILIWDPESELSVTGGLCQLPLPSDACPEDCIAEIDTGQLVVDVDDLTCGVPAECSICTQEVEFERDNVIRAKDSVLAQQLIDATVKLATAGCVTLDPSGRPVASNPSGTEVVSSTIDSPLQNLAIYNQLMQYEYVGNNSESAIDLRADDYLVSAARALGASASKEGDVTVDMVVYMNQILGLTEQGASILPRTYVDVREEVKGVMTVVRKWFLDFADYSYDREVNFSTIIESLPSPAYIPDLTSYGQFEYLAKVGEVYVPTQASILSTVFDQPEANGDMLAGFAKAADDTRAVINFIHLWAVPEEDATPILCDGTISDFYDVSISERSGLQVPVRMVAAGDGREGTLTIENDGPATARDIRITLQGVDDVDQEVVLLNEMDGYRIFEDSVIVSIDPGYSVSFDFFFSMDQATTITWTAKAIADPASDLDVNLSNNEVTVYTKVLAPKGSGGGAH